MRTASFRILAWLMACLAPFGAAQAAVTCSIPTIDSFTTSYDALLGTDHLGSGTFTVTCTRTASGDPTSVSFTATTNNGLYNNGTNNRAKLGASNFIKYDVFTSSSYATNWSTNSSKGISGSVTMGSGVPATGSAIATYYSKIPFGQTSPQGTYSDTITVSMTYGSGNTSAAPVTLPVQISNVPTCSFATPPSAISFTYPAFSPTAKTASTTFGALCSSTLAYTMALDSTSAVISGLRYTLALSAASGTGTGASQSYTITGTMDAGQAGTCTGATCTSSHTHTLTISY
jgi:spore coat protein U-like protein